MTDQSTHPQGDDDAVEVSTQPPTDQPEVPWLRLDRRMIFVDALRVVLTQAPALIALLVVGVSASSVWPLIIFGAWGVLRSGANVVRWVRTRYRVTDTYVELRTGLFVRQYRSVRRTRIRSADADARLLQRLARLRRVTIGAGQMNTASEAAIRLDAISLSAALDLRRELLGTQAGDTTVASAPATEARASEARASDSSPVRSQELARLHWWWVFYNMFSFWAYVMAAGLLWGGQWIGAMFGLDLWAWAGDLADWEALGLLGSIAVGLALTGVLGVIGMAFTFFTEHAHFRLERVPSADGTVLRTTQGLFRTREVTRDDRRLRGVALSEPLLWRPMRMTDTAVITTGLSMWSAAVTILPRGPRATARRVADAVLDEPSSPLAAPLRPHPPAALRRRMVWAATASAAVTGLLAWLGATTSLPHDAWWITALVMLPLLLSLALVGYRALGHTRVGRHLVVRSGVVSRTTSALRRDAVSGVRVRQSVFQRRLGLATVSVSTAAGFGVYEAPDLAARDAAGFALEALPDYVRPFLTHSTDETAPAAGAAVPAVTAVPR